ADDGLAVAEHVPRQAETRRDVVVIRIINAIHLPLGDNPGGAQGGQIRLDGGIAGVQEGSEILWTECAQAAMGLAQHGVQLVTQAVVQRQVLPQLETVLPKETITSCVEVAVRVADELQSAAGESLGKIDQRVWNSLRVIGAAETYLAAKGQIVKPVELGIADIRTHFEH